MQSLSRHVTETRCPLCEGQAVVRPVPDDLREVLGDQTRTVLLCEQCLTVHPTETVTVDDAWRPVDVTGALPEDPAAALALGILVTLLESLALNRPQIEATVAYLEEVQGVDPLLALDRLQTAPTLELQIDVARRREQLAQFL